MSIRPMTATLTASELAGKFICSPSVFHDQAHGYPAIIEKATANQIVFRKLNRASWDSVEKEWHVDPDPSRIPADETPRKCKWTSVKFICDTAEEAIALYAQALLSRKAIEAFRREQLALVDTLASENRLPTPAYLASA